MTKLSFVLDQEIKCWMLWSSNILLVLNQQRFYSSNVCNSKVNFILVQFMDKRSLNNFGLLGRSSSPNSLGMSRMIARISGTRRAIGSRRGVCARSVTVGRAMNGMCATCDGGRRRRSDFHRIARRWTRGGDG
jgi:hypothetical protein